MSGEDTGNPLGDALREERGGRAGVIRQISDGRVIVDIDGGPQIVVAESAPRRQVGQQVEVQRVVTLTGAKWVVR